MNHSFDTTEAEIYGLHESIILNNFRYWILKNKANRKHFYDDRTWTYNSNKALCIQFPYLSEKQIRSTLENLIENNILVKGNYNLKGYDRTLWYAFENEDLLYMKGNTFIQDPICPDGQMDCPQGQMQVPPGAYPFASKGEPIPSNKTNNKSINKSVSPKKAKLESDAVPVYVDALKEYFFYYEKLNKIKPKMDDTVGKNLKNLLKYLKENSKDKTWEQSLEFFKYIIKNWKALGEWYEGKSDVKFIYSQIDRIINEIRKPKKGSNGIKKGNGSSLASENTEFGKL